MLERGEMERGVVEFVDTESLVPEGHLLRKVDRAVDFGKLYEIVEPLYSEDEGRPSIDPVVLFSDQYDGLTAQLEAVRQQKTDLLQGANLPLPGLSVENGELTYLGKLWDCMSGSDQLKVSTAIVRALKPECGFVLLDKLEQMDLETLREFSAWMEAEGLQGIATRVSTGGECSIIIEDGYVKGEAAPAPVQTVALATTPTSWKAGEF